MFDGASASDRIPLGTAVLLGLVLIAAGGLLIEVGRRSRAGRLHRNWVVGIRTTGTLESDAAWNAAHRSGGPALQIAGVAPLLAGIVTLFRPANWIAATTILLSLAWLVTWVLISGRRGVHAAKAAIGPPS